MPDGPNRDVLTLRLEESLSLHAIDASIFAPFVIERLRSASDATGAELLVLMRDTAESDERAVRTRIEWTPGSAASKPVAVQERVVTEWAALGVACTLLPALTGKRVLSVAVEGERFDYRVGNDSEEWGLEVSGTLSEDAGELRERHRIKIRQLLENPAGIGGHVIIVGFVRRETLLTFHAPLLENTP